MTLNFRDRRARTLAEGKRAKDFNGTAQTATHPGGHLAQQLEACSMSAAELSRQLNVPANRITEILNGQRAVTGDTALRLGHFFHNGPHFWLNLQADYDLRIAEEKSGEAIKSLPTLPRSAVRAGRP